MAIVVVVVSVGVGFGVSVGTVVVALTPSLPRELHAMSGDMVETFRTEGTPGVRKKSTEGVDSAGAFGGRTSISFLGRTRSVSARVLASPSSDPLCERHRAWCNVSLESRAYLRPVA